MSTVVPNPPVVRTPLTTRIGLVLAGVLATADLLTSVPEIRTDPVVPAAIAALAVLGLVSVPFAWRGAGWARVTVIVGCTLSALTGLPAFFLPGVPAGWIIAAAAGIVLSLVVVVLLLATPRAAR